jgi:plastocyanin domain-containing protein
MSRFIWIVAMALALGACEKKASATRPAPPAPPSVSADGTRVIPINVNDAGYDPDKITAKPGEKLELEFTRRSKGACGEQIKVAGGPVIDLPLDQPVKIAVTAPASGQLGFACGMDMMTGVIVVN